MSTIKHIEENDDPSPHDLTQWISTFTSLQPNFEFLYPNTWKLDCMASGTLKLISPTEISPWFNQEDADDSVMDQIRVDFTQKSSSLPHEEIHTEIFKKLMSSYAISDYCEIEVLKDYQISNSVNAKKSLVQYTSYGRIQMTRHYVVTVSLQSCTYIFTYLTESLSGDKNLLVFYKFLNNFKFPENGSTFVYELQMNDNSILFDIPFPYQVVQKRECSLTTYTPSHAKFSSTDITQSKQLYFDFQVFRTNTSIETAANDAFNRAEGDFEHTPATNYTFSVLQGVKPTDLVPESFTFSYEYQHNEDKQERRFVEKYFTPLSTGDLLVSTYVNLSIPSDIQNEELQVFRKVLQSYKLVSRSERKQYSSKIVNSSSQLLGQQLSEFNITVYGESGVGKSTLIHQYLSGHDVVGDLSSNKKEHSYRKYVSKSDSHSAFVLNILDTCGNYEYESGCQFEKVIRADAVLLICSPDQQTSIDRIETFINRIERLKKRKLSEIPSLIVFNKNDIEENVLVKSEDAKKLADQYGITFFECTSKKQSKVNDLFDGALIAELYSKQYILNSMQSDQKKLSEDIENFQYLITQNQVDQISTLISESAFSPSLASEYLNLPIIFYGVDSGVEESTLRLLMDYNNKYEKYNLKNFTTKDANALNLAAFAAAKGNLVAIKVLEEYGITLDQTNTETNILAHILNNSSENETIHYILQKYESFLTKYVNVSFKDDENGVTYPIHTATKSGSTFTVKWLLSHEGTQTINEKDNLGLTPLLLAAAEGNVSIIQILLDSGAKITSSDDTFKEFLKENCPEDKLPEVLALLQ